MAAGLGFKDFVTGEVLTAADVDGYLMQGVWVFASAAARDAAVTSPQEGNFAYLKDTNVTTYYTGSAWANLDTTGMTNPMTTTGDTIYSSSGSTPARLGIGSTGQVLTVASGIPSWATPAGGGSGLTLIDEVSFTSSTAVNVNSVFTSTYYNYKVLIVCKMASLTSVVLRLRASGTDTSTNYITQRLYVENTTVAGDRNADGTDDAFLGACTTDADGQSIYSYDFASPNLAKHTAITGLSGMADSSHTTVNIISASQKSTTAFDGFSILCTAALTGKVTIYGYQKE